MMRLKEIDRWRETKREKERLIDGEIEKYSDRETDIDIWRETEREREID